MLQLLAGHLGVVACLEHGQVLLSHGVDDARLRTQYVGVGRVQLGLPQPGLRERLPAQGPRQIEAVARRPGGDALRKARREERLLPGPRVAQTAGRRDRGHEQAGPRRADFPGCGRPIVDRLTVGGVVGPSEGDGVGQREVRRNGALTHGEHRADGEPDRVQQRPHESPWTSRRDVSSYAARALRVSSRRTAGGRPAGIYRPGARERRVRAQAGAPQSAAARGSRPWPAGRPRPPRRAPVGFRPRWP